jgi:hypothetical protein
LAARQKTLQTDFIKNQNHVASAQKAAEDAKKQASKANAELYKLNIGFKNVSVSLDSKTESIGFQSHKTFFLSVPHSILNVNAKTIRCLGNGSIHPSMNYSMLNEMKQNE